MAYTTFSSASFSPGKFIWPSTSLTAGLVLFRCSSKVGFSVAPASVEVRVRSPVIEASPVPLKAFIVGFVRVLFVSVSVAVIRDAVPDASGKVMVRLADGVDTANETL